MRGFIESITSVIEELKTNSADGLTLAQVEENRKKYGVNSLTKKKPKSLARRLWEATTEPMLLMLIGAGLIALGVNIFETLRGGSADYLECIGIFVAIALSVVISVIMEGRSAKAFEALSSISDNTVVKAIRSGNIVMLNQADIVAGDILLLATGDKVPADGRLIESSGLSCDESMLTGESLPANKDHIKEIVDEKTPLAERVNMLYSGTYITSGNCKMVVVSVGDQTEFGKIASNLSGEVSGETPLQEKLGKLGKNITILGVIAAAVVFITQLIKFNQNGGLVLEEVMEAFVTSIVLIVAAVPEGLPTIIAVSLSINIIKLSKNNALVKKMIASETIGCINVICSDKTGTLTENRMKVHSYYDGKLRYDSKEMDPMMFAHNICLNTTADIGEDGSFIGNPTECAMLSFYESGRTSCSISDHYKVERKEHRVIENFPFSSELKHMTTLAYVHDKYVALTKGSPEIIFDMCQMDENQRREIEECIEHAQRQAMRVISFAHKELVEEKDYQIPENHEEMESNMVFDGFVAISDPLREDVYEAIESCKSAGVELKILTGDNIVTASAIADELQLLSDDMYAVEARDIEDLSDEELGERLNHIAVIARSTPTIKMRVVKLLKDKGNVVAVTGDGINDAPALKSADVGIAMGISGTEVSKEASDIVLLDDSFATIVKAVEWGRNIYENFKRFITFQLTVNFASVFVVFVSIIIGLKAPFTAIELLWINIIMDGPPALTLGLEPNYNDLMKRKPTRRDEHIISKTMLVRIVMTGTFISLVFLAQYLFNFLRVDPSEQATVLFTLFVLFQLFNSFNCRELHSESIFSHFFNNKVMLVVVSITFVLQIVFIQYAGAFFGTVPLGIDTWLKLIGTASSVIVLSELVKFVYRKLQRKK